MQVSTPQAEQGREAKQAACPTRARLKARGERTLPPFLLPHTRDAVATAVITIKIATHALLTRW